MNDNSTGKPRAASIRAFNAVRQARSPELKSTQKALLYALASRLNSQKVNKLGQPYAFPSYETLAGDAGLSRSACIAAVKKLANKGFLIKATRRTSRGASNSYTINVLKLESLSVEKQQISDEPPTPSTVRSKEPAPKEPVPPSPTRSRSAEYRDMSYQEYVERYQRQDPNAMALQAFFKRPA